MAGLQSCVASLFCWVPVGLHRRLHCCFVSAPCGLRCKLRRKAPQVLAQGLRCNKTLRQLNLAGSKGLDDAGASALAAALACSKVLCALNLAFVKLSNGAIDSLVQVRTRRLCAAVDFSRLVGTCRSLQQCNSFLPASCSWCPPSDRGKRGKERCCLAQGWPAAVVLRT